MQLNLTPIALFWVVSVTFCFNLGYFLSLSAKDSLKDRPRPVIVRTAVIGTLIMIGTYAHQLSTRQGAFELSDCLYLALVVAHGWTAEKIVDKFIELRTNIMQGIKKTINGPPDAPDTPVDTNPDGPADVQPKPERPRAARSEASRSVTHEHSERVGAEPPR